MCINASKPGINLMPVQYEKINTDINITDEKVRETLCQLKILPTQEEAYQTFWNLKGGWWKQIIDGRYHKFGKMVFDEKLHGGDAEPGYLSSDSR